jgi:ADP-heptose:LPS heptosyltransferase
VLSLVQPELPLLAGMLSATSAYLGNDSGVSHLAAALGAPSVVLYTRDKLDWRPWAPGVPPLVVGTSALEGADVARVTDALRALLLG